jgi:hypothetical protein
MLIKYMAINNHHMRLIGGCTAKMLLAITSHNTRPDIDNWLSTASILITGSALPAAV